MRSNLAKVDNSFSPFYFVRNKLTNPCTDSCDRDKPCNWSQRSSEHRMQTNRLAVWRLDMESTRLRGKFSTFSGS